MVRVVIFRVSGTIFCQSSGIGRASGSVVFQNSGIEQLRVIAFRAGSRVIRVPKRPNNKSKRSMPTL